MQKVYEFWGMQRSGNHAILNWQLENFSDGSQKQPILDRCPMNHRIADDNSFHTNDTLFLNAIVRDDKKNISDINLRKYIKLKFNNIIFSYEDSHFNKSLGLPCKQFVIMRNLENLIASRLQDPIEWRIDDNFFEMWETHARSNIPKIHYDKWLVDKSYRDSIAQMFNTDNKDITSTMSVAGGGSSFIGMKLDKPENLLTRYRQIDIPPDIKKKIMYYGERNPEFCNPERLKERVAPPEFKS
jgi:hypothetical protein